MAMRVVVVLVATLVAVSAGAARTGVSPRPILTYAVYPAGNVYGGLCATDLNGHLFRVSDPHDSRTPTWSPDGRSIAYTRWDGPRGLDHLNDVVVTDANGRRARYLTRSGRGTFSVTDWSPDGRELLINYAGFGSSLYAANANGSGTRLLVDVGYGTFVGGGSWSSAGKILFSIGGLTAAVYVVNADGGHRQKLVDSAIDPKWSSDGVRFAYLALQNGLLAGLGVANADGSGAHLVVEGRVGSHTWSPDGQRIAYVVVDNARVPYAIDVVEVETGSVRRIATGDVFPAPPAWSPDGTSIAFSRGWRAVSQGRRAPKLVLSTPDGTRETPVETGGLPASDPAWRDPASLPSDRRQCVVRGTARADVIRGTDRGDLVYGMAGDDRIRGNGGDDVLVGGRGHDHLFGGGGDDRFRAYDFTRDFLKGGPGVDRGRFDSVDVVRSVFRSR